MIIIAGTSSPGGISQVIKGYARDGVFDKWDILWVKTHVAGGLVRRAFAALHGFCSVIFWMLSGKVQLVHTHAAMRGSFWRKSILIVLARIFHVPAVVHLHGSEMKDFYSKKSRLGRAFIRSTLESADRVVVLSAGWHQFVREIAPGARISIIPNYSPAMPSATNQNLTAKQNNNFIFLFMGALTDRKGIYELIPAFAKLSSEFPDVELWIGGSGETDRVLATIAEYQLSRVRLLGWVDVAERNRLLTLADAFVLPSKNENLPLAIIEAMAASLPIITTHVGGIPEMLNDNEDAILVMPGRVDLLHAALKAVRVDKGRATLMAANALNRYRREFSPETCLPKIDELYKEILKINRQSNS